MPDNREEPIVVHISATLNLMPAQFAALLLRDEAGKHPAIVAALEAQPVLATSAPEQSMEPVETVAEPPATDTPPPPQPPVARAGRPPRANGKAPPVKAEAEQSEPPVSEPEAPLEEATVRGVLRLYSTVMPGRDTAVVKLLQDVGGAPRLADCPKDKWPAIVATAQQGIAEHAKPA